MLKNKKGQLGRFRVQAEMAFGLGLVLRFWVQRAGSDLGRSGSRFGLESRPRLAGLVRTGLGLGLEFGFNLNGLIQIKSHTSVRS